MGEIRNGTAWQGRTIESGTATLLTMGNGAAAMGIDATTGERGNLVKLVNRTGGASVKGTLVSASTAADREAIAQANTYDVIAVVQQAGVAEGAEMWCWTVGSICQVLYKDATAATRGNVLVADAVDGRGSDIANPGGGLPGVDLHFSENGHVLESKAQGTNVLVLCSFHVN